MDKIKVNNMDGILKVIEGSGYFGVRGISKSEIQYLSSGTVLPNSWSHVDDVEEFELDGLSTVGISDMMYEDEIIESIKLASRYSDCGRVILVNGKRCLDGQDAGESVIPCAEFVTEVEIEIL